MNLFMTRKSVLAGRNNVGKCRLISSCTVVELVTLGGTNTNWKKKKTSYYDLCWQQLFKKYFTYYSSHMVCIFKLHIQNASCLYVNTSRSYS